MATSSFSTSHPTDAERRWPWLTATSATSGYTVTVYTHWDNPPDPFAGVREPRRPLPMGGSDRATADADP